MTKGVSWEYEIRYPKGKVPEYKVNGEWIAAHRLTERREYEKEVGSTLHGFLHLAKRHMGERNRQWAERNRNVVGENEFQENRTITKLMAQYNKQVEMYGDVCPITLVKFTTIRTHRIHKDSINSGEKRITFSNISVDRILDHINYTKQNTLFTSVGWNLAKGTNSFHELKYLFKDDVIERYKKILIERFPDQAYVQ